jgi:NADH-quinone oxidoreductase subunit J
VGAIAILFIFVLMMLNLLNFELEHGIASVLPLGVISVLSLTTLIINLNCYDNLCSSTDILSLKEFSTLQIIGSELYGIYGLYLIMASLILLVAMIGAIVLTLQPSETTKKQNNFIQISRDLHTLPKNTDSINN